MRFSSQNKKRLEAEQVIYTSESEREFSSGKTTLFSR